MMSFLAWPSEPHPPASPEAIQLWWGREAEASRHIPWLWSLLSPEEQHRARHTAFAEDQQAFVIRRGILRLLLARYLDTHPSALRFSTEAEGKPALKNPVLQTSLHFNVSSSGGLLVYAFAAHEIGVDVEQRASEQEFEAWCALAYSLEERAELAALPEEERAHAGLLVWVCKEAYLKATGEGLTHPLPGVEISSLTPGEPPGLIRIDGEIMKAARWCLHTLALCSEYCAALVHRRMPGLHQHLMIHPIDQRLFCHQTFVSLPFRPGKSGGPLPDG